jgi:hypothetical protein
MSLASNRLRRLRIGQAGTTSLEFALVAIPFVFILVAGMDLGRYFLTQHSLRTLTSEAARATLVSCYGSTSACSLPTSGSYPSEPAVAAMVPFLASGSITWVKASQSAPNQNTGVRTISVEVKYPFSFILPAWTKLNAKSPIDESTSLSY